MSDDPFELPEPIDSPDEEVKERLLQEELAAYKKAMEEEFEVGVNYKDGKLPPEKVHERTIELLTQAVPGAVATMQYLALHGQTEAIREKASRFIIERAIGKEAGLIADPMTALLRKMDEAEKEKDKS